MDGDAAVRCLRRWHPAFCGFAVEAFACVAKHAKGELRAVDGEVILSKRSCVDLKAFETEPVGIHVISICGEEQVHFLADKVWVIQRDNAIATESNE
jgi:hypothetical protein